MPADACLFFYECNGCGGSQRNPFWGGDVSIDLSTERVLKRRVNTGKVGQPEVDAIT